MTKVGLLFGVALVAAAGCSSSAKGTITLSTGGEIDAFSRDPKPTTLIVETLDTSGTATTIARARLPADSLDLGDRDVNALVRLRVTASDDGGRALVKGMSLPVELGALDGANITMFVQRIGELARMPSPLADGREEPLATLILGRYVVLAGGADVSRGAAAQVYDVGSLSPLEHPPILPRTPASLGSLGTKVLVVDGSGATWLELADASVTAVTAPAGGTFEEIAGGATVPTPDGGAFVVGATRRAAAATARVLRIAPDGSLAFVTLATARAGAAATWVDGRGLVVAAGSSEGAGVEVLAIGATSASALPYPADATTGAGAAPLDASHVVLAGGAGHEAETRVVDLACGAACAASAGPALPAPLARADAVSLAATGTAGGTDAGAAAGTGPATAADALVVGDDASGASHVIRVGATAAAEVALKIPRRGARAVRVTSVGSVLIVGGATLVESYVP